MFFLYINGKTLEPCDSFQQATRTRNIKTLNYYINESPTDYIPKIYMNILVMLKIFITIIYLT